MSSLFEVTLTSEYAGQTCINRWNYRLTGTPAGAKPVLALANAMGFVPSAGSIYPADTVFANIRNCQVTDVSYQVLSIIDIYDLDEFYVQPFNPPVAGLQAPPGLSPVAATGFISTRTTRKVRAATKRFTGVKETWDAGQGNVLASALDQMNALAAKMAANVTFDDEGNTLTFNPVVLGKVSYTTPSGKKAYKYRQPESAQLEYMSAGFIWSAYDTIRSQTSRQYKRGK